MSNSSIPRTLVHSFITDTYLPWAELFLESLRISQNRIFDVRIDTYNVSENQKELLKNIYPGIQIYDQGHGFEEIAKLHGVNMSTVNQWRTEVAKGNTTDSNFPFKLFITVDKRFKGLQNVVDSARQEGYQFVIHSDIDIYFRKTLVPMLEMMKHYDVGFYFRKEENLDRLKTLAAFMVFKTNAKSKSFLEQWIKEIDSVPIHKRWRGFGQSTQYYAAEKCKNVCFADFTSVVGAPVYSKTYEQKADFWLNSNSILSRAGFDGGMEIARRKSWNDLKHKLPRIPFKSNWVDRLILIQLKITSLFIFRGKL